MSQSNSKYAKYYKNGYHRVPLWRIAGFTLNNTATNTYMFLMAYVSYYLIGFVGVATVLASSFSTIMRLWDGVTDPFIGLLVDKTNGKFGKNRPFMVIGQVILCVMSFIMYHVTHLLPNIMPVRLAFFVVCAMVYYIGYTFQCVVTKSAQTCLTNDPKQRPLFAMFDSAFNVLLSLAITAITVQLTAKYGTMYSTGLFHEFWLYCAIISAVFTVCAVFSIAPKDRVEFYGTGKVVKVGFRDYWDTIRHNRALQMLVLSASTDKLSNNMKTTTVTQVLMGVVAGSYGIATALSGATSIPTAIVGMLGIASLATMLGQRKAMIIGSVGGIVTSVILICLWVFGDATTMVNASGGLAISYFTVIYVVVTIIYGGFTAISGNIVITMTADVADYEVYRTGKYVPGMMGTLFSFVDKLISSLAPLITGLVFAAIGFGDALPDFSTPYSKSLHYAAVFLMYGVLIIGLLCNLIAMHFYPLTKEKMAEIQDEIAAIKAKYAEEGEDA